MNLSDRIKAAVEAVVNRIVSRYDYAGCWGYTVASQNDDGTVELLADRPDKAPPLSNIPATWGNPAIEVKLQPGGHCYVEFANLDPSQPVVTGWDPGSYDSVKICGGDKPAARVGDTVAVFLPPMVPFTGFLNGLTFTGTMTITSPAVGIIKSGSDKVGLPQP